MQVEGCTWKSDGRAAQPAAAASNPNQQHESECSKLFASGSMDKDETADTVQDKGTPNGASMGKD